MQKEQSLLLALRYHLSTLGYPESVIESQDPAISNFSKLLIQSVELESKRSADNVESNLTELPPATDNYKYYMYINNPDAWDSSEYDSKSIQSANWAKSYRYSDHGFLFDTFETDSDWQIALEARDVNTLNAIYNEVVTHCKHKKVPWAVYDFLKKTPMLLAKQVWNELKYNGIVDAYCDEDPSEYVDGFTGK